MSGLAAPPNNADPAGETPEIEEVLEGVTQTAPPFIPPSRFSPAFREYLDKLKVQAHPGIFALEKWNDPKYRGKIKISSTIGNSDMSVIWNEVTQLGLKYSYRSLANWMPIYYYLSSCVLKAKLECLTVVNVEGNKKLEKVVADAKRMLMYHDSIMTEMVHRYTELNYINAQDESNADGAHRKRRRTN